MKFGIAVTFGEFDIFGGAFDNLLAEADLSLNGSRYLIYANIHGDKHRSG